MSEKSVNIWVLTDGRAGNEAQALGLAEACARIASAEITVKRISLKPWAALVPPGLVSRLGTRENGWPFSGIAEGREDLKWPWPDLVISAGRRSAPTAAAIRELHGGSAVHLLSPQMPVTVFDAIVVPEHDALTGGNVLRTVGAMSRLTPDRIATECGPWRDRLDHLPERRVAVLIGGPSKSARFTPGDEKTLLLALESLTSTHGLMITPSRRTRPEFERQLIERLSDRAFVWDGQGVNPYPGILGLADAVLVTEDSINMASEAATSGLPVHIFPVASVASKFRRFHESLETRGASRRFTGQIETWTYEPLREADRIAGDLRRWGVF